jgi:RNA polymerase sigma-70 factor, ECF subfamily
LAEIGCRVFGWSFVFSGVQECASTEGVTIEDSHALVSLETQKLEFERFFADCHGSLVGQAYLLTGDLQEAQDLAQEALVQAWRNWAKVRDYDDPAGWARRVLHNFAISGWRRAALRRRALDGRVATAPAPSEARLELLDALGRLPVNQRKAVVLHDVVGLSAEEISTEMNARASTVRTWLHRGHRRLKEEIGHDR